jgi:hypothetical protein
VRVVAWFAVLAVVLPACKHDEAHPGTSASAARPSAAPAASARRMAPSPEPSSVAMPAASVDTGPRLLAPAKNCRALEVKGRAFDAAGRPPRPSGLVRHGSQRDPCLANRKPVEARFTGPGALPLCGGRGAILPGARGPHRRRRWGQTRCRTGHAPRRRLATAMLA